MSTFNSNKPISKAWPSKDAVLAASKAVEALVEWEFCDCGCPQQRSPASREAVDYLRIASFIRIELMI